MKTGGGAKKGIDMAAKERLIDLLRYVEELVGLTETTVFSVDSYRTLRFLEHELQNRVGIQHDAVDPEGAVWIRIERLQRRDPPKPATSIAPWLVIGRDPSRVPEIVETRLETMPRALAARLVEEGRVDPKDVMSSPRGEDVNDVRWRLDWLPDVKEAIDEYVSGPWTQSAFDWIGMIGNWVSARFFKTIPEPSDATSKLSGGIVALVFVSVASREPGQMWNEVWVQRTALDADDVTDARCRTTKLTRREPSRPERH